MFIHADSLHLCMCVSFQEGAKGGEGGCFVCVQSVRRVSPGQRRSAVKNRRPHPWGEIWPVGIMAAGYATEESRCATVPGRQNDDKILEYSPGM